MNKTTKQRKKYAEGGELIDALTTVTGGGDPNDPVKRPTAAEIKKKYAANPYVTNGRETWGQSLDATFPLSGNKVKVRDAINNAVKQTGISPSLLYTSAMEEGLGFALSRPNDVSEAYVNWETKNAKLASQYRVDGFYNYGLDRFGEAGVADSLIKKGYLPSDFKNKFIAYDAFNEKKEKIKTAAFMSDEDALVAKAAMLRDTQDQLNKFAQSKGYKLTPKQQDFFLLAGYNGGLGNMQKMIESYNQKGYLKDDKFLDPTFKPASYGSIYTNVQRRLQNRNVLESEGFFKRGGRMEYQFGTEDPITTGGPQLNPGAQNVGIDVFKNANTSPVPINPDAPADQQIFALQPQEGDPVQQAGIVPLSQFYEQYTDQYGNQQARGTGRYVNDQGQSNTLANQQQQFNQMSQQNLENANKREANRDEAEKYASFGMTAINNYFNKKNSAQQQRKDRRAAIMQNVEASVLNPYLEGTGSQAIFEKGGKISAQTPGLAITDGGKANQISDNIHSSPMIEFVGKEHPEGGIGVQYGQSIAEVEDKEIGWVDKEGGLNIFGKLKLPGSNMTFRKAAKNIAEEEDKTDKKMSFYTQILNNGDPSDPYQESSQSTAKVMFKSLDRQQKKIAEKKEALASYQNLILELVDQGVKMKYGGKLPRKPYETGGSIDPNDPASIQKIIDKYSGGKSPLKAEDFIEVAQKYGVPLDLMLAQAIQESNFGTKGRAVRSKNMFNVGNTDDGSTEYQNDWKAGLERYAKLIRDEYAEDPNNITAQGILANGFRRPKKGGTYASDPNYVKSLNKLLNDIGATSSSMFIPESYAGKNPEDKGFKYKNMTFSKADAQSMYNLAKEDPEHPLNTTDREDLQRLEQYLGIGGGGVGKNPGDDVFEYKGVKFNRKDAQSLKDLVDSDDPNDPDKHPMHSADKADYDRLVAFLNGKPSTTNSSNNTNGGTDGTTHKEKSVNALDYTPNYTPIDNTGQKINSNLIETKYGLAAREATPFSDKVGQLVGDKKRGWQSPLALEQIAPELITIETNRQEPVEQLTYQPDLLQTFDISYQLGRNENQSSFNQAAKTAESMGSVEALSQLAAQKYKADEAYNMQEVQGNAQQKQQVYAQNVATLNDAKVKNLALIADQQVKQAQAKFNTRKEDLAAFTSISGKILQNTLENRTYNAYANLFQHYGFDKMGNVTFEPDKVVQKFTAGEAQQFGMLSAQQGANAIMSGDFNRQFRKVKNADGSTTTTETLGRNGEIQAKARALKAQGFDDMIIGNMLRAEFPETISQD